MEIVTLNMLALNDNNSPSEYSRDIYAEHVRALYRGSVTNLLASLAASFALIFAFWDLISHTVLLSWYGAMLFVLLIRYVVDIQYRKWFSIENSKKYAVYFAVGAGMSGSLWGLSGVLFFPEGEIPYQMFLAVTLFGMGTGSVITNSAYLPAVFAFFPASLLPMAIYLFTSSNKIHISLGIMLIVALMALSYFAVVNHRGLRETLRLRFENVDLVKQLQEQKHEAEQANIAKSKFLAASSHDLRQPLHALTLFTSVLKESNQNPKTRTVVDQISASVDALQNLFNALLDISRLDAGVIKVEKSNFYLQPLLDKLSNDFNPLAAEKNLQIICPASSYAVNSDMALLERILRNYISNAIRYTEKGIIKIGCDSDGDAVTIKISDTGLGITQENQQVIFDEFHQLSNPERDRSKGLGLGLAIVQRTANLLGHPISVESQPGMGSTFSVSVPQVEKVEEVLTEKVDSNFDTEHEGNQLIVVIDDEASIRDGMRSLLEQWGYHVISAADEEEALNLLQQQSRTPDGIIADYRLREHRTGLEVIQAIHTEYNNNIPALVVTGDTSVDELREVNKSGFEVLHKPVAPLKLRAFLRHTQIKK